MTSAVVIHSNHQLLSTLCEILELHNIQAIGTNNGREGIQLAHQYQPNVIITDHRLPDTFGWKVAFNLLQSSELLNTPIVLISASQAIPELTEYLPLFDAYIPMPFNINNLISLIKQQIKDSKATISHSQNL